MKDYIYLDNDLLNSSLAQYGKGLVHGISQGKETQKSTNEENAKDLSKGVEGILGVGVRFVHDAVKTTGQELTKGQSETIDYVLSDYSTDLLLEKVAESSNLKINAAEANEGNYVKCSSKFKIYDFDLVSKIANPETLNFLKTELSEEDKKQIKELRNQLRVARSKGANKNSGIKEELKMLEHQIDELESGGEAIENIDMIHKGSDFANKIFSGSLLIKSDFALTVCKRDCFRLDQAQLSFLTESTRNIIIFGIVMAVKEKTHADGEFEVLENDDLNKIPNMFHDIFLSNFNMLKEDDRIIKPIAIFFE